MRKSKPALITAGTTLYATPPSSLVRFTEVTAPSFKWGLDCSLWWGPGARAARGNNVKKEARPPSSGHSLPARPVPHLCLSFSRKSRIRLTALCWESGRSGVREAPGESLGNSRTPPPCATHQLLGSCVLDESRAVARLPGADDPHPWETQGEGVPSARRGWESTRPWGGPGPAPHFKLLWQGSAPQKAWCGADSCPEGGPDLRSSSKRSPGRKGLGGRGPEFKASLGPCLFWPSLPSAQ